MSGLDLSCPDWWEKLQRGEFPARQLDLNEARARNGEQVFGKLRLPDVPGQPLLADAAGPWLKTLVRHIFGSVTDENVRWLREFLILVPKKNSKTTSGAGIMMTAMLLNERPRGEFLLVGPTQEVADTAFSQAVGMIEADEYLSKRFLVRDHLKTIEDRTNKAKLRIKTFDNKVMTGAKPVGVLLDEIHVLGKLHAASRVIRQIRGGILPFPEGFFIMITTQSDEPPTGSFLTELEYARQIRDGEVHGDLLPVLYEMPLKLQAEGKEDDRAWLDRRYWPAVLPNLDRSISMDRLEADFEKAKDKGEEELSIWASQHLNVQIGVALNRDSWAGAAHWPAAIDETVSFDALQERCDVVTFGIDGGGLDDLLGLCGIGREIGTKNWLLAFKVWAQTDVLTRRPKIADALKGFEQNGDLIICPDDDPTRDVREVAELVAEFNEAELLPAKFGVGLDAVAVAAIVDALVDAGIEDEQLAAVPQGYKLNGAIKGLERKLKDGTAKHAGTPLMNWVVSNAKAEVRGSATLITKQAAGFAKIDPLIAAFCAVDLMARNPEPRNVGSYLDEADSELMMV